jgi:hypothetical protein
MWGSVEGSNNDSVPCYSIPFIFHIRNIKAKQNIVNDYNPGPVGCLDKKNSTKYKKEKKRSLESNDEAEV